MGRKLRFFFGFVLVFSFFVFVSFQLAKTAGNYLTGLRGVPGSVLLTSCTREPRRHEFEASYNCLFLSGRGAPVTLKMNKKMMNHYQGKRVAAGFYGPNGSQFQITDPVLILHHASGYLTLFALLLPTLFLALFSPAFRSFMGSRQTSGSDLKETEQPPWKWKALKVIGGLTLVLLLISLWGARSTVANVFTAFVFFLWGYDVFSRKVWGGSTPWSLLKSKLSPPASPDHKDS